MVLNNPNSTDHWNEKWSTYESDYKNAHSVMYSSVRPYMKGEVVDLGCGNGYIGNDIGSRYHGIDISEEGIKKAKEYNKDGEFYVGSALQTPWGDRSFDTVLLLAVIEHFQNYMPLLYEAQRLCKNRIIATLPYHSRGPEHYHPHWPIEKVVDAFRNIGEVVEYRHIIHERGRWVFVICEVI